MSRQGLRVSEAWHFASPRRDVFKYRVLGTWSVLYCERARASREWILGWVYRRQRRRGRSCGRMNVRLHLNVRDAGCVNPRPNGIVPGLHLRSVPSRAWMRRRTKKRKPSMLRVDATCWPWTNLQTKRAFPLDGQQLSSYSRDGGVSRSGGC